MELRHLRYFVAVAEELHFGRAAEKLHIAQPPLSQQIQQLEREMGVRLFHRANRRVTLTAAGQVFLDDIRRSIAGIEQAVQAARRADRGEVGTLAVGFVASATYDILPALLSQFRARFPEVALSLYELNAAEQAQALADRRIHVGLARPSIEDTGLAVETVLREPFLAALPEAHPLAARESLRLAELSAEPFILFPADPKPSYADAVRAVCARAGFSPRVAQEAREMQTALSLIAAGLGVTLVPASTRNLHRRGLVYRPLHDADAMTELTVAYRRDDLSPVLPRFLEIVREFRL
ncbi:MAG: LysR family transcriptional regulator [Armatimonadetes bacterium]|nr:LysR family transcriptional regulator [Armatimonadota bacterium]